MDETSVQIGSPLEEVKFREAILDLRDAGCLRAVTDLGAAGLNSAVGEMADPVGVWMNTALVPLKTAGLPMWRILVSESQERMLLAVPPERLDRARRILARHEVRNSVIGRFTGDGRYCVVHDEAIGEDEVVADAPGGRPAACPAELGFDLPYNLLDWTPEQKGVKPPPASRAPRVAWPSLSSANLVEVIERIAADPEVTDQAFAALQYDSSVQGGTHYGPLVGRVVGVATGYFASRPLLESRRGVVFATAFNPWLSEADPVRAARHAVLAALTAQVLAGVAVQDVCLCDNFYTPHLEPHGESWLVGMVDELARLSVLLGTPFISGKDSSAGSTRTTEGVISVPPAVFISALGKVPDVATLRPEPWSAQGNLLVRVGPSTPALAGTAAARALELHADATGGVDDLDAEAAKAFVLSLAEVPLSVAPTGRRIDAGGIVATALLGAIATGLGCELDAYDGAFEVLLQEHRCGALLEVPETALGELAPVLMPVVVGRIVDNGGRVTANGTLLSTDGVNDSWRHAFGKALR